jgi:hypothetical protein
MQAMGFLNKPICRREKKEREKAGKLLIPSRNRLNILRGARTGHCHLKEHLFKQGQVKKRYK